MASRKRSSPRQKMINLMYLVFIAMLALNVPAEILDGFELVNENLLKSIENTVIRNNQIYGELEMSFKNNPEKTKSWFDKASGVKGKTDSLYNYIQSLKIKIAHISDGKDANVDKLKNNDNLDASSEVMLSIANGGQGKKLKDALKTYRDEVLVHIQDSLKRSLIEKSLFTEPSQRGKEDNKSWEESYFESMPSIAALTYLSELQLNIKQAEGEALNYLLKNVDFTDFRVNELNAFVIPESRFVMQGTTYKANIVLAAVDTTQRPKIVVNGKELPESSKGLYQFGTGTPGSYNYTGYIETSSRDGNVVRRPFTEAYTVMEPMATIAPLLMDVLYAGINNPISVSAPGVTQQDIRVTADGGSISVDGKNWIARPVKVGQNMTIVVSARINEVQREIYKKSFRVRALPDPLAFIQYPDEGGNPKIFKRGQIARSSLLNSGGLKASIDDGILNIPFTVLSFKTFSVDGMGNATPEVSQGASFSERQLNQIRNMQRGKQLFITDIKVKGPDGIERTLTSAMDIRLI